MTERKLKTMKRSMKRPENKTEEMKENKNGDEQYIEGNNGDNQHIEESIISMCVVCGEKPYYWIEFGPEVAPRRREIQKSTSGSSFSNNELRKTAYKEFYYERHGIIGKNQRIQIPHRVLAGIRKECADELGE